MTSDETSTLRTEAGIPVGDNQRSQTAGPAGPVLLQDAHLVEKLARFNRERIPERVVHAVGSAAYGHFEVTNPDVAQWTKMKVFAEAGKRTPVFFRFSTVAASKGGPDTARDPRGFAIKFYSEDGNWDLVGNNTPVFFLRDGIKFPDFVHSQKYDPHTNRQEPNNVWDFFSRAPEATHQFVWLFGDRGIPASYRHMNGYGSHTFMWVNASGEKFWVKFHFKVDQGIQCLGSQQAETISGADPQYCQKDLYDAIETGNFPSWTLKVQVMPEAEAATYRFNPFDLTKVWPHSDYPLVDVGKLVLDRVPDNYFAEVEQATFSPANMVPGIGPSPDKMLQARLFAYGDAQRYRVGVNHGQLPVNAAKGVGGKCPMNHGRDGAMCFGDNGGGAPNYEPNGVGGPVQTNAPYDLAYPVTGEVGTYTNPRHDEDDDFAQAGSLFRLMSTEEQQRLVANLAGSLAQVTRADVRERSIGHFAAADSNLGRQLRDAVAQRLSRIDQGPPSAAA